MVKNPGIDKHKDYLIEPVLRHYFGNGISHLFILCTY